jgi:UDP-N-acetylmuramoyl-L-alanyl-D-glutamate--2,6-diaminopimelate ligase
VGNDRTGLDRIGELLASGVEFSDVVHDSRHVVPGSLYVCLRGANFDGHEFAPGAVADGAAALLTDHHLAGVGDTPQVVVDDTRVRVGPIAALLNGHPSASLTAVGITGTNGKTTTAHLLEAIFVANGWRTGVIGTLHGPRTTPEAPELQRTLRGFVDDGADAAVLEVSSHALALHRVDGTRFDAVVFTNLGHDHLDLHGSQEEYFRAKARLFSPDFAPVGIVNIDDPYGQLLADASESNEPGREFRVVPTSMDQVTDVAVDATSHRYRWRGVDVVVPIGGHFNVANSLAALTTAVELGVDPAVAVGALAEVAPVPGRFQLIRSAVADRRGITVVVDYAHTPDGLAELLTSARSVTDRDLTIVFGCGGERDHPKRPEMGRTAAQLADHVVVTSDNPRREDPAAIVDDILAGVAPEYRQRVVIDVDRRTAIRTALDSARAGDLVVIAGKGHERVQEYADRTVDFDDVAVATELLEEMA